MKETNLSIHQIELAVAQVFGVRDNIIVPNVSWGFFATHEADLVIINKTGYLTEVEIKRSWQDFLNDFKKHTTHDEDKVVEILRPPRKPMRESVAISARKRA